MIREAATKTSDQAGDGTTTATVLAHAIVRDGVEAFAAGLRPKLGTQGGCRVPCYFCAETSGQPPSAMGRNASAPGVFAKTM